MRPFGRAHSPPTWAWYEELQPEDLESGSEEDGEGEVEEFDSEMEDHDDGDAHKSDTHADPENQVEEKINTHDAETAAAATNDKGKQRAIETDDSPPSSPEAPRKHKKPKTRMRTYTSRPILTIKSSQGFVWNQELFVPSYIKDRYILSTSPPTLPSSADTYNSSGIGGGYEVEVVEIRVEGNELEGLS